MSSSLERVERREFVIEEFGWLCSFWRVVFSPRKVIARFVWRSGDISSRLVLELSWAPDVMALAVSSSVVE